MMEVTVDGDRRRVSAAALRCATYVRTAVGVARASGPAAPDAQRDVCAAYIRNELRASWVASFEDVGFSGFDLERPALQLLLSDVEAGVIDAVVVFHVDRLSRSARELAELLARFEDAGVLLVVAAGAGGIVDAAVIAAAACAGGTP